MKIKSDEYAPQPRVLIALRAKLYIACIAPLVAGKQVRCHRIPNVVRVALRGRREDSEVHSHRASNVSRTIMHDAFSQFIPRDEAMQKANARHTDQKLRLRIQNLLIERMQASLTAKQDVPAADPLFLAADPLVADIGAGLCSVDEAVDRLLSEVAKTSVAAGQSEPETNEGGNAKGAEGADGAEGDALEAELEGTDNAEAADAETEPRAAPFVPAPTFYSGGAEWRGKQKANGISAPIGTPAAKLALLASGHRRSLRPHQSRPEMRFGGNFGQLERFQSNPSFVERDVMHERGPAMYSPQWTAESTRKPGSLAAPFSSQSRFPRGGGAVSALATAGAHVPYLPARSAVGEQVSSMLPSKPAFGFGTASRDHGSAMSGTEAQRRSRPGPGSYNA